MTDEIQRRARVDLYTAELAIREAMLRVEEMGADVRLTRAVTLLGEAKDAVADYVDGQQPCVSDDENERNWKALKAGYEAARAAHLEIEFIMTFGLAMAAGDDVPEAVRVACREWDL